MGAAKSTESPRDPSVVVFNRGNARLSAISGAWRPPSAATALWGLGFATPPPPPVGAFLRRSGRCGASRWERATLCQQNTLGNFRTQSVRWSACDAKRRNEVLSTPSKLVDPKEIAEIPSPARGARVGPRPHLDMKHYWIALKGRIRCSTILATIRLRRGTPSRISAGAAQDRPSARVPTVGERGRELRNRTPEVTTRRSKRQSHAKRRG